METGTVLQLPENEARRALECDGGNRSVDGDATSSNPFAGLVSHLRASWLSGKTRPLEYRVAQLEALGCFLDEKKQQILEATASDLGKAPFEAELSEIFLCKNELHETLNNLSHWMKDKHVDRTLAMQLDSAFIRKDPYGVVLIIAPWNYPIQLFLVPLIGAIAAGNCVIVKPSEVSKNTERLVAEALPGYLDKDCFAVVTGGVQETTRLLENKFDYIFFTGMSQGKEKRPAWILSSLPFGGIGNSGLGLHHGKFSFDTFSHHRGCLKRGMGWESLNAPRYPPYCKKKFGVIQATSKVTRKNDCTLL
ncbi:PREDICTED: aldehyde dehydrogenase family 3 member B1-like [Sturnus vulgaris]|uniref:aldehyde dehydrogenase family 3 member B1-like n=1 Tax=Sturnus vulgaris TaxID=9172 RepID=UPI00071A7409|nr:PREDICTED: aldehyde dehydrogenase family 3 member B1-like [Sturnus vulgaris]